MISGTYPDMYIVVYADNKIIGNFESKNVRDVSQQDLPQELVFNPITTLLPDDFENISILIYDYDSVSGHDNMGGFVLASNDMDISISADGEEKTYSSEGLDLKFKMTLE